MSPRHWTAAAACAGRLDLPWTTDTADVSPWQAATMRAVCHTCPVLLDCLAAVDDLDVAGGWWAGADRDPNASTGLGVAAWAADTTPATREPAVCWHPSRRRGRTVEQAAYVLESDPAGAWHLGGVAGPASGAGAA